MKTRLILISLLLACLPALGQNGLKFKHLGTEDGLGSMTVYCVFQDKSGMIWFGTDNGLSSYDSNAITSYSNRYTADETPGTNIVHGICEDATGVLWLGTASGLWSFDRKDRTFSRITLDIDIPSIYIRSICMDANGVLWMGTMDNGVYRYDPAQKSVSHYDAGTQYISKILTDGKDGIWCISNRDGLYHLDSSRADSGFELAMKLENANTMCPDYSGGLWIAGWDAHIQHYDPATGALVRMGDKIVKGRVHNIHETSPGTLMYGSDAGLSILDIATSRTLNYSFDPTDDRSLSDDFVYDMMRDREGGLWVTTYYGGVCYSGPNSSVFSFISCTSNGAKGRITSRMCEDSDGDIWTGTDDGGLFRLAKGGGKPEKIIIDRQNPNLNIHALLPDGRYLWVGTYSQGLYRYDKLSGDSEHFRNFSNGESTASESVYSLLKDRLGRLWIGTKDAVYCYRDGVFSLRYECGSNSDVIGVGEDQNGNVWFASSRKGLLKYDSRADTLTPAGDGLEPQTDLTAMCLLDNRIVYAKAGNGVYVYSPEDNSMRQLGSSNQDISRITSFSLLPKGDELWIASDKGLFRLDTGSGKSESFDTEDGLHNDRFTYNSCLATADGRIFIGANGGMNIFRPEDLKRNPVAPGIAVSGIPEKVFHGDPLTIDFAALSYCSPKSNQIRHQLSKLSRSGRKREPRRLVAETSANSVTYRNLPRGSHVFTISAGNGSDTWSNPSEYRFEVVSHWYDSILFHLVCGLAAFGLLLALFLLLRSNSRQRKDIREEQRKRDSERIRADAQIDLFSKIAQEMRTPVMLISAPADEALKDSSLPENVRGYLNLIKKHSDRLYGITTRILTFKHDVVDSGDTDPDEVMRMVDRFASDFSSSDIDLAVPSTQIPVGAESEDVRRTVMIVESEDDLREFLTESLSDRYDTVIASDGARAYTMLKEEGKNPDAIICDIYMPNMNGLELCHQLKSDINFAHIPTILLSSNTDDKVRQSAVENGADVFVEKPVNVEYLKAQLDGQIKKRMVLWNSFAKRPFVSLSGMGRKRTDEPFLKNLSSIVVDNMSNQDLDVDKLAELMHTSRSVLFNKVKNATGMTPNNFIKTIRLRSAAEQIAKGRYKINEICYMVGFNSPSYFARCFREEFGVLPKDFTPETRTEP